MFWGLFAPPPCMYSSYACTSPFLQQAMCIQNMYNPMLSFNSAMTNFYGSMMPNPMQMYMNQAAYNTGFSIAANNGFTIRYNTIAQHIASLGNDINEAIESDKITDEQRTELKQLKKELEALVKKQEEFQKLRNSDTASYDVIDAKLFELGDDYRTIKAKAQSLADRIKENIVQAQETTGTQDTPETTETQNPPETTGTQNPLETTETSPVPGLNLNVDDFTNKNSAYQGEIVFAISTRVDCSGTGRAAFIDKRGVKHTYTASTGVSFTRDRARRDIANQIRQQILDAGFTNVTLSNPNGYKF